jgi:hypothetical protein
MRAREALGLLPELGREPPYGAESPASIGRRTSVNARQIRLAATRRFCSPFSSEMI